jgi:hypothetical protein
MPLEAARLWLAVARSGLRRGPREAVAAARACERALAQAAVPEGDAVWGEAGVLLTRALCRHPWELVVARAIDGGADAIQVREKDMPGRALVEHARAVRALCAPRGVATIVNDRLDIALAAGADGVHLGTDDLPVREARRIAGASFLIGASTHSPDEARAAVKAALLAAGGSAGGAPPLPAFLRNKLAQAIVAVAGHEYPDAWPSFFHDLLGTLGQGPPAVDLFCRILTSVDEDIISLDVPRSAEEAKQSMHFKDSMRERSLAGGCRCATALLCCRWSRGAGAGLRCAGCLRGAAAAVRQSLVSCLCS